MSKNTQNVSTQNQTASHNPKTLKLSQTLLDQKKNISAPTTNDLFSAIALYMMSDDDALTYINMTKQNISRYTQHQSHKGKDVIGAGQLASPTRTSLMVIE